MDELQDDLVVEVLVLHVLRLPDLLGSDEVDEMLELLAQFIGVHEIMIYLCK